MGQLRSKVWVSASFQIFALSAGGNVLGGKGNCMAGNVRGNTFYTRIQHLYLFLHYSARRSTSDQKFPLPTVADLW